MSTWYAADFEGAPPTMSSGDPTLRKALDHFLKNSTDQTQITEDACKPGPDLSDPKQNKRDRSGSKKRTYKNENRKKAKAARKARKANR